MPVKIIEKIHMPAKKEEDYNFPFSEDDQSYNRKI